MVRTLIRRILVLVLLFLASPVVASNPSGLWALRAEGKTLMLFEVQRTAQGWKGAWTQPEKYSTDGDFFTRIESRTKRRIAREAHTVEDGVELVFDSPWPGGTPDHVIIRVLNATTAGMTWAAFNKTPYILTHVKAPPPFGPWQVDRDYVPDTKRSTSVEMTEIFNADQAARADPAGIDWKIVLPADAVRRTRTQTMLDLGLLASGDDFYHAAYVFQHGDAPDDFLKAHALAVIAISRGRLDATWIAAATLDRYLQRIGQSQIYGTQFNRPGTNFTQEPYRRNLLSDAVRRASHVPALADQEQQLHDWDERIPLTKTP
jgi:hypothetical protein